MCKFWQFDDSCRVWGRKEDVFNCEKMFSLWCKHLRMLFNFYLRSRWKIFGLSTRSVQIEKSMKETNKPLGAVQKQDLVFNMIVQFYCIEFGSLYLKWIGLLKKCSFTFYFILIIRPVYSMIVKFNLKSRNPIFFSTFTLLFCLFVWSWYNFFFFF